MRVLHSEKEIPRVRPGRRWEILRNVYHCVWNARRSRQRQLPDSCGHGDEHYSSIVWWV